MKLQPSRTEQVQTSSSTTPTNTATNVPNATDSDIPVIIQSGHGSTITYPTTRDAARELFGIDTTPYFPEFSPEELA